jgi:Na+-transporting NADH:ubiquinone oxidoreductase subunit A
MPTAPFSVDLNHVLQEDCGGINIGLALLNKLTSGDVNLVLNRNKQYSIFDDSIQAVKHEFSGPHPSGNTGIHIHHIDPISDRNDIVWYISLQDLNDLGNFFKDGVYPTEKYISVAGSCVSDPAFYKIKKGMLISDILKDQIVDDESMLISGDVLSGNKRIDDMPVNFYHEVLSVIPHLKKRDFLGWISPGLKKYSLSRTFLSSLFNKDETNFDTRINGSRRAIIPFGRWEAMLPMDLMPDIIVKSILAKDIEDMEKYGIYECDHEDFALCAYACQSKVEVSKIIKEGLSLIEEEG